MREEGRADTLLTLHVVTHIHINTPVLTDGCLTVSNGLMPLTGRTQVRDPTSPLDKESSVQKIHSSGNWEAKG